MFVIDEATNDDVGAVVELESALFVEDAGRHDPHADTGWPAREGRRDAEQLLASPDATVLVARAAGAVVGMLVGYATPSSPTRQPVDYAILRSLYVADDWRRQGVAGQLTERFLAWARDRGCVEAHVDHYAANAAAGGLYQRLGFAERSVSRARAL